MSFDIRGTVHRIYNEINVALWALLCVATIYVAVFVVPHLPDIWARAERQLAQEIAAENVLYCGKWGMARGTPKFESCALDLQRIRAAAERRLAESEF
jgi:hypothetical protein